MKSRRKEKIFSSIPELISFLDEAKKHQAQVVFTNGCFDILHAGHIDYLEKAAQLADVMIVAINDDQSVQKLKGNNRPITPLHQRIQLIAALECVDAVVSFSEDTPLRLITKILPDVLVKGSDYSIDQIVGANEIIQNGGHVETIDFVENISSSIIVEKIKAL